MPLAAETRVSNPAVLIDVLKAIASADGQAWFPGEFAQQTGTPRADLDAPTNALRVAGLIEVVDWVRGRGQGYALTAEGRSRLSLPGPLVLDGPRPRAIEANPSKPTPFERGEHARAALFAPRPALVTPTLIVVITLWFLAGLGIAVKDKTGAADYLRGANLTTLLKLGAVSGLDLARGEWWRLGTCVFVHIGLLHFAVNLFALVAIGPVAEGLWGRWRFLLVFFGGGLAGAATAMAVRPDAVLAGASGAVWGVLASVGTWLALYARHFPAELVAELASRLGFSIAINALISLAPGVSWEAHLGGALGGVAVAVLAHLLRPGSGWKALAAAAGLIFLPLFGTAALKRAMDRSNAWAIIRNREELRQQAERIPPVSLTVQVKFPVYERVRTLFNESIRTSIRGIPEQVAAVRAQVVQTKNEAAAARTALDHLNPIAGGQEAANLEKSKAYLDALVVLLVDLEEMLAPDRKPDVKKAAAQGKHKLATEKAWQALIGASN